MKNFSNAILHGEELISPGIEGINELTLSNDAYLSEWQGNREITIPFDSELYDSLLYEKAKKSRYRSVNSKANEFSSFLSRWQVRW